MRCHPPRGKPPPRVYWLQNGRKIDPNQDKNFLVTAEGHLIVVAARLTDSANYSCVAENIANTRTSDSAAITVYGKTIFSILKNSASQFAILLSSKGQTTKVTSVQNMPQKKYQLSTFKIIQITIRFPCDSFCVAELQQLQGLECTLTRFVTQLSASLQIHGGLLYMNAALP